MENYSEIEDDLKAISKGADKLVDMPVYEFYKQLEKFNAGEIRVIRSFMERIVQKLSVDTSKLMEVQNGKKFDKKQMEVIGSMYAVCRDILSRIAYIDYQIEKRKITFS